MGPFQKSNKLNSVCYDIRGPVAKAAKRLEDEGHNVLKLNIGNPAPFGFDAPEELFRDVIYNLHSSQGYCESKGLFSARKAVMQHYQGMGLRDIDIEDIYIGNGASELILMATQALLNNGDEVLIPAPDYPLWTAAVHLAGGAARHYLCDEESDWMPDLDDIRAKISPHTKAIVIINPNNPTGAVYSKEMLQQLLQIAREHNLVVFSDEIYDKILYDDACHTPTASLCDDLLIFTFNGLSKAYRAAGFRSGWMLLTGALDQARGLIEGLDMLASMRLCANVPMQHAIQASLGGYQSINELILPTGRLHLQRDKIYERINAISGISVVKPKGALYAFAKLDTKKFNLIDDEKLVLDLLHQQKILLVHGTAFNWPKPDHLRFVFLPHVDDLDRAMDKLEMFLHKYQQ